MSESALESKAVDFTKAIDKAVLVDQTAIVTGGASGIGRAIAEDLASHGAIVTILDLDETKGNETVNHIATYGKAYFVRADVTQWSDLCSAFEMTTARSPFGSIDILVTAAGVTSKLAAMPSVLMQDKPVQPPTSTFDINFVGTYNSVYLTLWYFARASQERPKQILLVASLAAYSYFGKELTLDYIASKFGVRGLFIHLRNLINEYGQARINMLAPSLIDTPLLVPGLAGKMRAFGMKLASLEDATDGAARLLYDSSINGRVVVVASSDGHEDGSGNFDVCDDLPGYLGGKVLQQRVRFGAFGKVP